MITPDERHYFVNEKGCWIWRGTTSHGYAIYRQTKVARWMWEQKHGRPMAPGKLACHTCDNLNCINPEHVYEGTHSNNLQDAWDRGRRDRVNTLRKLTDEQVREIRAIQGLTVTEISRRYKLGTGAISEIRRGITYKDVT